MQAMFRAFRRGARSGLGTRPRPRPRPEGDDGLPLLGDGDSESGDSHTDSDTEGGESSRFHVLKAYLVSSKTLTDSDLRALLSGFDYSQYADECVELCNDLETDKLTFFSMHMLINPTESKLDFLFILAKLPAFNGDDILKQLIEKYKGKENLDKLLCFAVLTPNILKRLLDLLPQDELFETLSKRDDKERSVLYRILVRNMSFFEVILDSSHIIKYCQRS